MTVLELRQYTMVPGKRDAFVSIFERHFIESQEDLGIEVVGQFRDLDREDRFVWMRRFADMEARRLALESFYDGPSWLEHRDAANATMTEWHDVLLMTPAWPGADLPAGTRRPPGGEAPDQANAGVSFTILSLDPSTASEKAAQMRGRWQDDPTLLGAYVTLRQPNTYPRLPIRDDADVLVLVAAGDRPLAADDPLASQVLRLQPTARSRLPRPQG